MCKIFSTVLMINIKPHAPHPILNQILIFVSLPFLIVKLSLTSSISIRLASSLNKSHQFKVNVNLKSLFLGLRMPPQPNSVGIWGFQSQKIFWGQIFIPQVIGISNQTESLFTLLRVSESKRKICRYQS